MTQPGFSLFSTEGRRVTVQSRAGEEEGSYVLTTQRALPAGVYILQASQGTTRLSQRVLVME